MTTKLPQVQDALTASSALTSIVGNRISMTSAPQTQDRPYVVWNVISAVPENQLAAAPEDDDQRVQVDCWSASQSECRRMMQAAVDACEELGHIVFGPWSEYEEETKMFRWSFDLEVLNPR